MAKEEAVCVSRVEAARLLGISVTTLDRLAKAGEITRLKPRGRVLYRPETLEAWAREHECRMALDIGATSLPIKASSLPAASTPAGKAL
jgi:excisionase family DNA binding protein